MYDLGFRRWRRGAPGARSNPAIVIIALVLASCGAKPAPAPSAPAPPSIFGRVRVLDADSLIIDGRHTHLSNAYAPESLLHARCWAEVLANEHAADYVNDLIDHAQTIDFKPNGETDEFNRALGTVAIDGADLGDLLYQRGLAARVVRPRFNWCAPISKKADGAPTVSSLFDFGH